MGTKAGADAKANTSLSRPISIPRFNFAIILPARYLEGSPALVAAGQHVPLSTSKQDRHHNTPAMSSAANVQSITPQEPSYHTIESPPLHMAVDATEPTH